tara:strand:- start:416 stop:841 length:426 start_codon:yes stop_codon:yes gene_type:complete
MKKLLFLFSAFFALNVSAQQQSSFDSRLLFRYEAEFLENLEQTNPSKLAYLNFYVGNSYSLHQLEEIPAEKLSEFPDILDLINVPEGAVLPETINETNFNILVFDVVFKENQINTYRIGDSNMLVYLKSKRQIYTKFNEIN